MEKYYESDKYESFDEELKPIEREIEKIIEESEIKKYTSIRNIFESSVDKEIKQKELFKFPKKVLKKALLSINKDKYIERAGRYLYVSDFTGDQISKTDLIKIYLDIPLDIDENNKWMGNEEKLPWFQLYLKCIDNKCLPVFNSKGEKIYINTYVKYSKNEFINALKMNSENKTDLIKNEMI